ncbi:MAG: hypothetical protein OEV66_00430 [Spirochaetia bacterium]|nr:hypothetical protein [Spirochaetia bacterium]
MSFSVMHRGEINPWKKLFSINPEELAIEFDFYDLYSGDEKQLLIKLREVLGKLNRSDLSGPIYLIVRELLTNSLKATYKRIYLDFFLAEMGFSDLPYENWLSIFKTEIETHMAENFANLCRQKNLFVKFVMKPMDNGLLIEIINDGVPSDVEWVRLQKSIDQSRKVSNMGYIFDGDGDGDSGDKQQEGAGLGVPLITVMLKNMNLSVNDFDVIRQDGHTIAKIFLPLGFFAKKGD